MGFFLKLLIWIKVRKKYFVRGDGSFSTHCSLSRLRSNNKWCFMFLKGVQLTLQLDWEQANPLLLLCLPLPLMLPTYTQNQHSTTRSGSYSAESHSRKCWKPLTEVDADESGGRPGSGSASDEPKSGAKKKKKNHEPIPRWETAGEVSLLYDLSCCHSPRI